MGRSSGQFIAAKRLASSPPPAPNWIQDELGTLADRSGTGACRPRRRGRADKPVESSARSLAWGCCLSRQEHHSVFPVGQLFGDQCNPDPDSLASKSTTVAAEKSSRGTNSEGYLTVPTRFGGQKTKTALP